MAVTPQRKGAPACAGLARQLYGQGVPVVEIVRRTGLAPASLYWWIDRRVTEDGTVVFDPVPRRRSTGAGAQESGAQESGAKVPAAKAPTAEPARRARKGRAGAPRARLLARLWATAERQVAQIEARMAAVAGPEEGTRAADAEKDARALALIARTLRELSSVEDEARVAKAGKAKGAAAGAGEGEGHGAEVRDRDAFRRELARRLDRLRAEGEGEEPSG